MLTFDERWSYSFYEDSCGPTFETEEEAIEAGLRDAGDITKCPAPIDSFIVGKCRFYHPELDGDDIIRMLQEDAYYSELGGTTAEFWLDLVSKEDRAELGRMLTDTLHDWLRKVDEVPDFFLLTTERTIGVGDRG